MISRRDFFKKLGLATAVAPLALLVPSRARPGGLDAQALNKVGRALSGEFATYEAESLYDFIYRTVPVDTPFVNVEWETK